MSIFKKNIYIYSKCSCLNQIFNRTFFVSSAGFGFASFAKMSTAEMTWPNSRRTSRHARPQGLCLFGLILAYRCLCKLNLTKHCTCMYVMYMYATYIYHTYSIFMQIYTYILYVRVFNTNQVKYAICKKAGRWQYM